MNQTVSSQAINGLSETLLIPLWAKAIEAEQNDPFLLDTEAARMMQAIDYDFSRFKHAKMSQVGCCARAALFDKETRQFLAAHPDGVVVQLGAGLDTRFERLGKPKLTAWYDLDLPNVIAIRQQLLPAQGNHYLSDSMFNENWMKKVAAHNKPTLVLIEGILMYFNAYEVQAFFATLTYQLSQATVVFDAVPPKGLGHAKYHDALKHLPATQRPEFKWALADAKEMEEWKLGLSIQKQYYLSRFCQDRYPWWARMLYSTEWGRQNYDMRIVRLQLN